MTPSSDDIDRIVARAQTGDRDAFHELVIALQHEVRLFVASRAYSLDLIEEILQATFVTAWEKLGTYQTRGSFLPWLKGIAKNRLREEVRERARFASHTNDSLERVIDEAFVAHDLESAGDDDASRLSRCLERLAPRSRELIERHYAKGLGLNQLAQQFKQTRQAIASALHRIRRTVRACCDAAEETA
ncbi:MAG: sigma-70 family RNA polymerase sigma factor [Planctomycetes bacterium]|nr:sigma-70 family RNA polymerase sigma factor [Planctomycetota bacterium]